LIILHSRISFSRFITVYMLCVSDLFSPHLLIRPTDSKMLGSRIEGDSISGVYCIANASNVRTYLSIRIQNVSLINTTLIMVRAIQLTISVQKLSYTIQENNNYYHTVVCKQRRIHPRFILYNFCIFS